MFMHRKTIFIDSSTDIHALSHKVGNFYRDRGYAVDIYTEPGVSTVVDAMRKKRRLHSVYFKPVRESVKVIRKNNFFLNNVLIFLSLTIIQANCGRVIGGIFDSDSIGYAVGLAAGIVETLFCFIPGFCENRRLDKVIAENADVLKG